MRLNGEWYQCDDDIVRPVIRGEVLAAGATRMRVPFLVDTGADCTAFSAAVLATLGLRLGPIEGGLGGVGGVADSVAIETRIRLTCDDAGKVVFRGRYAAFTELEALDMSVLGRDIMNMFGLFVDKSSDVVSLLRPPHRCVIEQQR